METKNIIGHEIHTLDNMLGRHLAALCEKDGLTHMQSWFIGYLYEHSGEDIFQKDIEAQFHIARSTATGILQLMEKKGFLRREPVPYDARLKRLVLTEKSISHHMNILHNHQHMERLLRKNLSEEQVELFINVIHQMKQNIESDI